MALGVGGASFRLGDPHGGRAVHLAILPVVRGSRTVPVIEVLGTGFFVGIGTQRRLVTAKHVIQNNPLVGSDESYAVVYRHGDDIKVVRIDDIALSPDYDVAAGNVKRSLMRGTVPLKIARQNPALNDDIFCYEYSSTRIEKNMGNTHVAFEPYFHKGNTVRFFDDDRERGSVPSFLTSFPALQGASGAPVIGSTETRKFAVVGMMVRNVERHLMAAQIVEIRDGDKYSDSTSYFLPYGQAISHAPLSKALESLKIPFEYADK